MSGRHLEDIQKVSGGYLECVRKVTGKSRDSVRRLSGRCLESIKSFCQSRELCNGVTCEECKAASHESFTNL